MAHGRFRRGLVAALLVPLVFFLSGCETNFEVNVNPDGMGLVIFELDDPDQQVQSLWDVSTCDEYLQKVGINPHAEHVTVEDMSEDGALHCRASSTGPKDRKSEFGQFTDNGDTVTVTLTDESNRDKLMELGYWLYDTKVNVIVNMPGRITEATGKGTVSGNTYKIENGSFLDLADGIKITSKKSDNFLDSLIVDPKARRTILPVIVGLLAAVTVFFSRRHRPLTPGTTPPCSRMSQ